MTIRQIKTKKGLAYQVDVTKRNFGGTGKPERFRQSYNDETLAKIVELKVKAALEAGSIEELDKLRGGNDSDISQAEGKPELSWYRLIDIAERDHWKTQSEGYQKTALINARQIARFFGADTNPAKLTREMVEAFDKACRAKGNSNNTINKKLATLRTMLECAGLDFHWLNKVKNYQTTEGRIRTYSFKEQEAILKAFTYLGREDAHDLVALCFETGGRLSEMLKLNIKDVNPMARSLTFNGTHTKSGKNRSIGLSQTGLTIINGRVERNALGQDGSLFPMLTKDSFQHYWKHMREVIGMQADPEFVFHAVRHTVATRLIEGTGVANKPMPIAIVKEWLGHSTIATTMKYVHVSADHLKGWVD